MKICLVATFPPSGRQLNEYAFHIARELQANPDVELTILADELTDYEFATDENGNPLKVEQTAGAARIQRDPLLEVRQPGNSGAPAEHHSAVEARCRVVQPCLLQLCDAGESCCRICGAFCACSHACRGLFHAYHPAPHYRACRLLHRRRAAGKSLSHSALNLATRALLEGEFGFCPASRLPSHIDHEVFRSERAAGHARNIRVHSHPSGFYQARQSGSCAFWPSGIGEPISGWKR